jgi:hypothetical protein
MPRPLIRGPDFLPSKGVVDPLVTGSFGAPGSSNSVRSRGVDVSISGTFVGTVLIERFIGGNWQAIESTTAPIERYIENDLTRPVRVRCSAWTSGTINYVLEGR